VTLIIWTLSWPSPLSLRAASTLPLLRKLSA
jgi:hypothetical protein